MLTFGDYSLYATPGDETMAKMLHLPSDKNKLLHKMDAQTVWEHRSEYEKNNKTVDDIVDQICKDRYLYPYV